MSDTRLFSQIKSSPVRLSYFLMASVLLLTGVLRMTPLLLAAFFAFLALELIQGRRTRARWFTVGVFGVFAIGILFGLWLFISRTLLDLPQIADEAFPVIQSLAERYQFDLPFKDYESFRSAILESMTGDWGNFARAARGAGREIVFLGAGVLVAMGYFLNPVYQLKSLSNFPERNLYASTWDACLQRFRALFASFRTVMGAQIIISGINTALTTVFVVAAGMPHKIVVVGLTFLCGLVPVMGNIVSNIVIVGIGLTVSPRTALVALAYLVVIHKLEYLLNSKIIGHRIGNPLWLTLLGLVVGERLLGISGMILAPVLLHYIKSEVSQVRVGNEREA
ncbi:MAG: AI-2E family transporter [Verrucomicrobiota bacterium]